MKKKIILTIVVVAVLVAVLVGCTTQEAVTVEPDVQLAKNGNFELNQPATDWTVVKAGESGDVTFTNKDPSSSGYDADYGRHYAVVTAESGKKTITRMTQKVEVQAHCIYEMSVDYRITSALTVEDGQKGAYFTLDGFKYFYQQANLVTDGWQTWKLYFNSDDYEEVTIVLGVGETDAPVQGGTVYFDNVSLKRIDAAAAEGIAVQSLSLANTVDVAYNAAYRLSTQDIVFTVLIVVLSAGLLVAAYFVLRRLAAQKEPEIADNGMVKGSSVFKSTTFLLVATLAVGFAIRLVLTLVLFGYGAYENGVMTNVSSMVENGLPHYYFNYSTYYAPGTMYLLYIMGLIASPLGLTAGSHGMAIFLKIPALLADLIILAFVFLAVDKRKGAVWAFVSTLALALLPVFYIASSLWGVYTSVATLFLVLTFMAVRSRQVIKMTVFYFFAVLFAEEALILLPLLLSYAVVLYVKYPDTRMKLPIAATAALIVGYAITVPLALDYYVSGHPFIVLERYVTVFNQNTYFARNVFNAYAMCAVGADTVNTAGIAFGAIFAAAAMLGGIGLYLKNRNRQDILLYAAWTLIAVYTLCVRMNLWVLMMGLVLLVVYVLYTDEKRLAWVAGALSVISSINACYVMAVGGNVKGGIGASGVTVSNLDPVAIVFSVLAVITFLGFTYVVADVCLGRKKPIMPLNRGLIDWAKATFAPKAKEEE